MSRNFLLIVTASIILGAPMPMLILLGVLAGQSLAPSQALATLPASIQIFSGILVAIPISMYMGKAGRRSGFILGAGIMVVGGLCAAFALRIDSFVLLCVAHLILGAALIALNFFRFAAAESVEDHWKANAISLLLASGLAAALLGPLLYTHFKDALLPVPFAGAYIALAGLGLLGFNPLSQMGKMMPKSVPSASGIPTNSLATKREILTRPVVLLSISTAAIAMASMVLLMIPTPLAMEGFGHEDHHSANVIRWHVVAMFAPGFFTGPLINRFGCMKIISTGFVLLLCAGLVALQGTELVYFYLSLVLLGIGWNFSFIGGTFLLQSSLTEDEKPLIQGINDTILAAVSSLASLTSGVLFASFGWSALAIVTLLTMVFAIVLLSVTSRKSRV
jgi:predicted MFS family arabinose efflux permease